MISDLDGFVQWIENEASAKRIPRGRADKIVRATGIVQDAMEEFKY